MSGPSVNLQQPQAPSAQSEVNAFTSSLPAVYAAQEQYALPMAQAQQSAMQQLYPQLSQLPENLATQANAGMQSGIPTWMQDQYKSDTNAQLGANAGSPIGSDYMSRGLLQQNQNWRQYYQGLASGLTGLQGVAQPNLNYMQGFTPNSVMQGMNQNYGTSANIYGSNLGYQSAQNSAMMNLIGSGIGAVGSAAGAALS